MNIHVSDCPTRSIHDLWRKAEHLEKSPRLEVDQYAMDVRDEINSLHNFMSFMQPQSPQCAQALLQVANEAALFTQDLEPGFERDAELRKAKRCFGAAMAYFNIDTTTLTAMKNLQGLLTKLETA